MGSNSAIFILAPFLLLGRIWKPLCHFHFGSLSLTWQNMEATLQLPFSYLAEYGSNSAIFILAPFLLLGRIWKQLCRSLSYLAEYGSNSAIFILAPCLLLGRIWKQLCHFHFGSLSLTWQNMEATLPLPFSYLAEYGSNSAIFILAPFLLLGRIWKPLCHFHFGSLSLTWQNILPSKRKGAKMKMAELLPICQN